MRVNIDELNDLSEDQLRDMIESIAFVMCGGLADGDSAYKVEEILLGAGVLSE